MKKVLAVLSDDVSEMPKNWNRRFKHNRDKIKTGDIYELAEVVRNLAVREQDKGLSTGEKQMYTRAKKILASEMMYALEKSEDEAEAYLDDLSRARTNWRPPPPRRSRRNSDMAVALLVAAGSGERLGADGPRRSSFWPAGRCSSGRSRRCGGRDRDVVVALPRGVGGAEACIGVAGGATARSRCARRSRPRRAGATRSSCTTRRGRWSTPEHFARCARRARQTPTARSPPRRVTDTVKEAGPDGLVTATLDRSRLWAIQTRRRSAARRSSARSAPARACWLRHR